MSIDNETPRFLSNLYLSRASFRFGIKILRERILIFLHTNKNSLFLFDYFQTVQVVSMMPDDSIPLQEAYELSDTSLQHDVNAKAVSNAA